MTAQNPSVVVHEIFEGIDGLGGLKAACAGDGKPAQAVYLGQRKDLLGASPALLVMFGGIGRGLAGVGTQLYENAITIELQFMVYNGTENNPLAEDEREDAIMTLETSVAQWCATHQRGTNYRFLKYLAEKTQVLPLDHIDGSPYLIMTAYAVAESRDTA